MRDLRLNARPARTPHPVAPSMRVAGPTVLLIGHGSRQPYAVAFVSDLAAMLRRADPETEVATGFLELNRPTPGQALRELADRGATRVRLVPLLFTAGYHYRVDLPAAADSVRATYPRLGLTTAAPLLTFPDRIVTALDARLDEAVRAETTWPATTPLHGADGLVLLAPGSSDPGARSAVVELARTWGIRQGLRTEAALCDLGGGEVRTAIAALRSQGAEHIHCGSLFLSRGRLFDAARRSAVEAGAGVVAGPLGTTPALVDLVVSRCLEPVPDG